MLINEAIAVASVLDKLKPKSILDCGSGTRIDREIVQPHIAAAFNHHNVIWSDLRPDAWTNEVDFTAPRAMSPWFHCDMVTALSILEHVTDIDAALRNIASLTEDWLLVSVPRNYPEHHCPIDNGWRPSVGELSDKLSGIGFVPVWWAETAPEQFGAVEGATATIVLARKARNAESADTT